MKLFRKGSGSTTSTSSTSKDSDEQQLLRTESRNDGNCIAIEYISRKGERTPVQTQLRTNQSDAMKSNTRSDSRQRALNTKGWNPKRLLCFRKTNFDQEDEQYGIFGDENALRCLASHRLFMEYGQKHGKSLQFRRQNNIDGDEFCNNYSAEDRKDRGRAIVLTAENAQVIAALSKEENTSLYAPLRQFNGKKSERETRYQDHERQFKKEREHLYHENLREFQRRQHSLIDDLSSIQSDNIHKADKSENRRSRGDKKNDDNSTISMISSMTSKSYSTAGMSSVTPSVDTSIATSVGTSVGSSVILSPHSQGVPLSHRARSKSSKKTRRRYSRRGIREANSNLGTIAESYNEYDGSSTSSSSDYSLSSGSSESDSECSSDSDIEEHELSVIFADARRRKMQGNERTNAEYEGDSSTIETMNGGCSDGPYWNDFIFNGNRDKNGNESFDETSSDEEDRISIDQIYIS